MAEIAAAIVLENITNNEGQFKSIDVVKDLDLEFDLGRLLATDPNEHDLKKFKSNKDEYLKHLARDNTQLLINKIFQLPAERREDATVAKLPPPKTRLPREKPIPKAKPPTKWEEYSKARGIQNRKKSKLVWDETAKEWKPRWGYKRVNDEKQDWMLEVPVNADPYEDQFAKRSKEKQERVSKNEFQRLRNIAKAKKIPVAGAGIGPIEAPSKEQMTKARNLARVSTASVGKFTQTLPKEKLDKKLRKKRKFDPLIGDMNQEKDKSLAIINKLSNKKPKLDVEKAVSTKKFQPTASTEEENKLPQRSAKRRNKDKRGRNKGKGKQMGGRKTKGKVGNKKRK